MTHLQEAAKAAIRRRSAGPEVSERIHEHHDEQDDWKGACGYCKADLTGTVAQLKAHRCAEFEASNESSR